MVEESEALRCDFDQEELTTASCRDDDDEDEVGLLAAPLVPLLFFFFGLRPMVDVFDASLRLHT